MIDLKLEGEEPTTPDEENTEEETPSEEKTEESAE